MLNEPSDLIDEPDEPSLTNDAASASEASPRTIRTGNMQSDADKTRSRQALELQRERILSERTSSPHRRSALATALASVEEQLAELGWMLHL